MNTHKHTHGRLFLLAVLALLGFSVPLRAQDVSKPQPVQFERRVEMIPMRDGVKLNTVIFIPKNAAEPLPILMQRTPYGVSGGTAEGLNRSQAELIRDGYIFAFQDIRGKFKSEGEFQMNRPPKPEGDPKGVDESTDTYDTIEWLVKNVPNNNGRVGMFGISYPGWLAVIPLINPHPALKALSPQAVMGDTWLGDDFFHQGGFRLSYGYEYVYGLETAKDEVDPEFDTYDTFEWYLKKGPTSNLIKPTLPTWRNFIEHPNFDEFWKRRSASHYLKSVTVPTLHVAGWFDQEDFYGPIQAYLALEKNDRNNLNYIVVGPWNHGAWARGEGDKLGNLEFKQATARYFREKIQAPWFAFHLKGKGKLDFPEAQMFETGSNEWKSYAAWPPSPMTEKRGLYFHADGKLSFDPPTETDETAADTYVSDPAHPVPYRKRPIEPTYSPKGSGWYTWLTEDQRFVHNRPDVLSWETDVLTEDVTITGEIMGRLFASTTGSDADWIVKLIDVLPQDIPDNPKMGGYQMMVTSEVLRGRFRNSFEKPEAITPNQVTPFNIYLHHKDHCFKKGHKIMVQVQSTWFPVIDRNPQTFVPNIFEAREADYKAQNHKVFRSRKFPSHVEVSVVKK
jgi:putative CocE/NonD family hydrolase